MNDLFQQSITVMQRDLETLREQLKQALTAAAQDHSQLVADFHTIASGLTNALKSMDIRLSALEALKGTGNVADENNGHIDSNLVPMDRPGREL